MRPNIRNDNSAEENWRAKENNAILQLMLIVGSFAVGYIPNAGTCSKNLQIDDPVVESTLRCSKKVRKCVGQF